MFKVESYLSPLLMRYLDKFVKLKPEDFKVSLWGGDVILNNLELRSERFNGLIPLPIAFISGQIHELRLHVPWTKLVSESIVITLNTVECILALPTSSKHPKRSDTPDVSAEDEINLTKSMKKKLPDSNDVSPGYLQGYFNRLLNNVHIIVNNLIVKFVEDDIVVSMNAKSVECFSTNSDWIRTFVDVNNGQLSLHKVVTFTDVTVCLDRMNNSGHISVYQDPIIYRCSLTCRLRMQHEQSAAMRVQHYHLHVHCGRCDVSFTDSQLPMLTRLVQLIVALYYGTYRFPDNDAGKKVFNTMLEDGVRNEDGVIERVEEGTLVSKEKDAEVYSSNKQENETSQQTSWASWAWSYVPQILPSDDELSSSGLDQKADAAAEETSYRPVSFCFGVFVEHVFFMLKYTRRDARSSLMSGTAYPKRDYFIPFLRLSLNETFFELSLCGLTFFSAQLGASQMEILSVNDCVCGVTLKGSTLGVEVGDPLLVLGKTRVGSNFMEDSLFGNFTGEVSEDFFTRQSYQSVHSENAVLARSPAFFFDYVYTMELVKENLTELDLALDHLADQDGIREHSGMRLIMGKLSVTLCSTLVHALTYILQSTAHSYPDCNVIPRKRTLSGEALRPPVSKAQLARLHEYVPNKMAALVLTHVSVFVQPNSCTHPRAARVARAASHRFCVMAERIEVQLLRPMYPGYLVGLVTRIPHPSDKLITRCYMQLTGKLVGMALVFEDTCSDARQQLLSCSAGLCFEKLLFPQLWKSAHMAHVKTSFQLPELHLNFNSSHLYLLSALALSWTAFKHNRALCKPVLTNLYKFCASPDLPFMTILLSSFALDASNMCNYFTLSISLDHVAAALRAQDSFDIVEPLLITEEAVDDSEASQPLLIIQVQFPGEKDATLLLVPFLCHVVCRRLTFIFSDTLAAFLSFEPFPTSSMSDVQFDSSTASASEDVGISVESQVSSESASRGLLSTSGSLRRRQLKSTSVEAASAGTASAAAGSGGGGGASEATCAIIKYFSRLQRLDLQLQILPLRLLLPLQALKWSIVGVSPTARSLATLANKLKEKIDAGHVHGVHLLLPTLQLLNHSVSTFSLTSTLPVTEADTESTVRLPWTLQLNDFCVLWSFGEANASASSTYNLVNNSQLSATVAASPRYHVSRMDRLTAVSWCIHVDVSALELKMDSHAMTHCITSTINFINGLGRLLKYVSEFVSEVYVATESTSYDVNIAGVGVVTATESQDENEVFKFSSKSSKMSSKKNMPISDITKNSENSSVTLWLQVTVPSVCLAIDTSEKHSLFWVFDSLSCSLDLQDHYQQFTLKLGNTHSFLQRDSEVLPLLGREGRFFFALNQQTSSSTELSEKNSKSAPRGVLHVLLTRSYCHEVRRKYQKKMRPDCDASVIQPASRTHLVELTVCLEAMDLALQPALFDDLALFMLDLEPLRLASLLVGTVDVAAQTTAAASSPSRLDVATLMRAASQPQPHFVNHKVPLLFVELRGFRLFLPQSSLPEAMCLMLMLHSLHVTPYAENPLERQIADPVEWTRAVETGALRCLGAFAEDRQYQVKMQSFILCRLQWNQVLRLGKLCDSGHMKSSSKSQIPALEWNLGSAALRSPDSIALTHVVERINLCVILAPAILLPVQDPVCTQVLLAGYACEVNISSDIVCQLDATVIQLGSSYVRCVASFLNNMRSVWNDASASSHSHRMVDKQRQKLRATLSSESWTTSLTALFTLRSFTVRYTLRDLQLEVSLRQPYAFLQLDESSQRLDLSCHDAELQHILVDTGVRSGWFLSRAGRKHPSTGVPLSLFQASFSNFAVAASPSLTLHFDRPARLILCPERLIVLERLMSEVKLLFHQPHLEGEENHPKTGSATISFDSVNIRCAEFTLQLAASRSTDQHVALQWSLVECSLHKDQMASRFTCKVVNFNVAFQMRDASIHQLLLPCELSACGSLRHYTVEEKVYHQFVACVHADIVDVDVEPQLLCTLHDLVKQVQRSLCCSSDSTARNEARGQASHSTKDSVDHNLYVLYDNLRDGTLKYVTDAESISEVPPPMQIHFHEANEHRAASMTWSYSEPRFLCSLHLTPVPFRHVELGEGGAPVQLACTLEFHDSVSNTFLPYVQFTLNENTVQQVELPTVASSPEQSICAFTWRVTLDPHQVAVYLSPLSLAACFRLDSCFTALHTPYVAVCANLPNLTLHLRRGKVEVMRLSMREFKMHSILSFLNASANLALADMTVFTCQPAWQRLKPFVHSVSWHAEMHRRLPAGAVAFQIAFEPLHIQFDADSVAAVLMALGRRRPMGLLLYNQSGLKLGVRQASVTWCPEEELAENATLSWSWPSMQLPEKLQLAMYHDNILHWSQQFALPDVKQQHLLTWRSPERAISLVVERHHDSQLQFTGPLVVHNRLPCALQVESCVSESVRPLSFLLESGEVQWMTVELAYLRETRFQLVLAPSDKELPWSETVTFTPHRINSSWRIKMWYRAVGASGPISCTHVWCTLLQRDALVVELLFSPMYLLENMLPGALYLSSEENSASASRVFAPGCGKETHHFAWAQSEAPLRLHLYWSRDCEALEPILQLPCDLDKINALPLLRREEAAIWPYLAEESNLDQSAAAGNCWRSGGSKLTYATLQRRWLDTPTILLSVTPWLLLINCCQQLDLMVQCGSSAEPVLMPADGGAWMPTAEFDLLCVGVVLFGSCHWSTWSVLADHSLSSNPTVVAGVIYPDLPYRIIIRISNNISLELNALLRREPGSGLFMQLLIRPSFRLINRLDFALQVRSCQLLNQPLRFPSGKSQLPLIELCGEEATLCERGMSSGTPLLLWHTSVDVFEELDRCNVLVLARHSETLWACPFVLPQSTGTMFVSLPSSNSTISCVPLVVRQTQHLGITYVSVERDLYPDLVVTNLCPWTLLLGEHVIDAENGVSRSREMQLFPFVERTEVPPNGGRASYSFLSKGTSLAYNVQLEPEWKLALGRRGAVEGESWSCGIDVAALASDALPIALDDVQLCVSVGRKDRKTSSHTVNLVIQLAEDHTESSEHVDAATAHFVQVRLSRVSLLFFEGKAAFCCFTFDDMLAQFSLVNRSEDVQVTLTAANLQMDNLAHQRHLYDFPVVIQRCTSDKSEESPAPCFGLVIILNRHVFCLQSVQVTVEPLALYLEDRFIYDLANLVRRWLEPPDDVVIVAETNVVAVPTIVLRQLRSMEAVVLGRLTIEPLQIYLTAHASLALYLSCKATPLHFSRFELTGVYARFQALVQLFTTHYVTGALLRAGWLLGSLELLGNPSGLIQELILGLRELTCGGGGLSGLARHTVGGLMESLVGLASSLSRNMDRLGMDHEHQIHLSRQRHCTPDNIYQGVVLGLNSFGLSLLAGVAGLVDKPLQKALAPTRSLTSVAGGVLSGVIGAVAKPVGGLAELVAETGRGFMSSAGLRYTPTQIDDVDLLCRYSSLNVLLTLNRIQQFVRLTMEPSSDTTATSSPSLLLLLPIISSSTNPYTLVVVLGNGCLLLCDDEARNIILYHLRCTRVLSALHVRQQKVVQQIESIVEQEMEDALVEGDEGAAVLLQQVVSFEADEMDSRLRAYVQGMCAADSQSNGRGGAGIASSSTRLQLENENAAQRLCVLCDWLSEKFGEDVVETISM